MTSALVLLALIILSLALLMVSGRVRPDLAALLTLIALGLAGLAAALFAAYTLLIPGFNQQKSDREIARPLKPLLRPGDIVCTYYLFGPEVLMYYLDHPVTMIGDAAELRQALAAPRPGAFYLLVESRDLRKIPADLADRLARVPAPPSPTRRLWLVAPPAH